MSEDNRKIWLLIHDPGLYFGIPQTSLMSVLEILHNYLFHRLVFINF